MINREFFRFSPEVNSAIDAKKPVVALESTVIAHGLPRPQNLETARRLEAIVRGAGATPATIAILGGKLCIGLQEGQLRQVAQMDAIRKISTRDLPLAVAHAWNGATTVASTIWIAYRAGIAVFATGGIGGVHRGALPDVSADLPELARTPIVVVCSGAKIIVDLPATREWLETHGVAVVGYQCDEMPAFYSRYSALKTDVTAASVADVAKLVKAQRGLGIERALLVTVPVPAEVEVPSELLKKVLDESLRDAEHKGIAGLEITPFLLSRMAERSGGATIKANIALLENNAQLAAEIARALDQE